MPCRALDIAARPHYSTKTIAAAD